MGLATIGSPRNDRSTPTICVQARRLALAHQRYFCVVWHLLKCSSLTPPPVLSRFRTRSINVVCLPPFRRTHFACDQSTLTLSRPRKLVEYVVRRSVCDRGEQGFRCGARKFFRTRENSSGKNAGETVNFSSNSTGSPPHRKSRQLHHFTARQPGGYRYVLPGDQMYTYRSAENIRSHPRFAKNPQRAKLCPTSTSIHGDLREYFSLGYIPPT